MTDQRHLLPTRSLKAGRWALAALAVIGSGELRGARLPRTGPDASATCVDAPSELVVEVVVTGRDGRPARAVGPSDFEVTVDGRRRGVLSIARLYQGPGADVIARQPTAAMAGEARPFSDRSRVVIVAIDQASLLPGEERVAREVAESCMDLLGLSDRIGVLALPVGARTQVISFDRAQAHGALSRLRAGPPAAAAGMADAPNDEDREARDAAKERAGTDPRDAAAPDRTLPRLPEAGREAAPPELPRPAAAGQRAGAGEAARAVARWSAASTLDALRRVLVSLESLPRGKTVLFLSGGLVAPETDVGLRETIDAAARAHARIISLQLPTRWPFASEGAPGLRRLADDTGGWLIAPAAGRPQQAVAQVVERLALSFLLLLDPAPGDAAPTPHALRVQMPRRKDLSLWAPRLVAPGLLSREQLVAAMSPAAPAAAEPVEAEGSASRAVPRAGSAPVFRHDHSVDLVLARASEYVDGYAPVLSSIVAEERYVQNVSMELAVSSLRKSRTIRSDFLTVRLEGNDGWVPFRDVFEVDGRPVRDRQDRLTRLFLERPSADRLRERRDAIMQESARYNIGTVSRTLNVPTLPLLFLEPASTGRFAFRKAAEGSIDGRRVWVLDFTETTAPTFIKTTSGKDVRAWGSVWVNPLNGTVHKTELHVSVAAVTVTYGRWPGLADVWVPLQMKERYEVGGEIITGDATYSSFRQFQVTTQQEVQLPKK